MNNGSWYPTYTTTSFILAFFYGRIRIFCNLKWSRIIIWIYKYFFKHLRCQNRDYLKVSIFIIGVIWDSHKEITFIRETNIGRLRNPLMLNCCTMLFNSSYFTVSDSMTTYHSPVIVNWPDLREIFFKAFSGWQLTLSAISKLRIIS